MSYTTPPAAMSCKPLPSPGELLLLASAHMYVHALTLSLVLQAKRPRAVMAASSLSLRMHGWLVSCGQKLNSCFTFE